jgi:arylsulfatase A-like enzyme
VDNWFLHLHIKEPHAPYNPPDEYLDGLDALPEVPWDLADKDEHYGLLADWPTLAPEDQDLILQHLRVRYDGDLVYTDDLVESMWIELLAAGLLEDTLLVVWNDHGEGFFEHDTQGHAYKLYPEENAGVLFFWAFNIVQGEWNEPTSSIDLAPTLLGLQGIEVPSMVTGVALGEAAPDRPVFSSTVSRLVPRQAVRMGDRRLEYSWDGRAWLYDVLNDPAQTTDLFDAEPDVAAELWSALEPQVALAGPLVTEFASVPPSFP